MIFFDEKIWRFEFWAELLDILKLINGAHFVSPVVQVVRDALCPLYRVIEDYFEHAVRATLMGLFFGECTWNSLAEVAC